MAMTATLSTTRSTVLFHGLLLGVFSGDQHIHDDSLQISSDDIVALATMTETHAISECLVSFRYGGGVQLASAWLLGSMLGGQGGTP